MSKKTVSQMEALLKNKIEKAQMKLEQLQKKHKVEIGNLAYKHGLHSLSSTELDLAFSRLANEVNHAS